MATLTKITETKRKHKREKTIANRQKKIRAKIRKEKATATK